MPSLLLYSTDGCHLCDRALELIKAEFPHVEVNKIDIAYNDDLYQQHKWSIPVVVNQENSNELGWPFDAEQLKKLLEKQK